MKLRVVNVPTGVPSSSTSIVPPLPTAVLSESILELTVLIDPLITVLTAVLRLVVEDMAPLKELLIWDSDVLWPVLVEIAPLNELLIWDSETLTEVLRLAVAEAAIEPVVELPWAAKDRVAMPMPCIWLALSSWAGP